MRSGVEIDLNSLGIWHLGQEIEGSAARATMSLRTRQKKQQGMGAAQIV
jgi:hypothetical protein